VSATVRNVAIVAALAAALAFLPGGGQTADVVGNVLSVMLLGGLAWFAARFYLEHRIDLDSLGERRRGVLYLALGVLALTITASDRLWATGAGTAAWFALVAASVYALVAVYRATRLY